MLSYPHRLPVPMVFKFGLPGCVPSVVEFFYTVSYVLLPSTLKAEPYLERRPGCGLDAKCFRHLAHLYPYATGVN